MGGYLLLEALHSADPLSSVAVQVGRGDAGRQVQVDRTVREAAMCFLEDIPALGTQHPFLMKQLLVLLRQEFFARHSPAFS